MLRAFAASARSSPFVPSLGAAQQASRPDFPFPITDDDVRKCVRPRLETPGVAAPDTFKWSRSTDAPAPVARPDTLLSDRMRLLGPVPSLGNAADDHGDVELHPRELGPVENRFLSEDEDDCKPSRLPGRMRTGVGRDA